MARMSASVTGGVWLTVTVASHCFEDSGRPSRLVVSSRHSARQVLPPGRGMTESTCTATISSAARVKGLCAAK